MARKKKNADFQKVKIKAGKRLPKHLNETVPEFKAKKIKIKPFANSTTEDFVKLLSHSTLSKNLKLLYLSKLSQILRQEQKSVSCGEHIQAISKYITDVDGGVRSSAINCLKLCLNSIESKSNPEKLSPILSILLTFINCGITHIDGSIRNDSQKFLVFIFQKCDASLDEHMMQMFLSKLKVLKQNTLESEYYNLLEKFVERIVKNSSKRSERIKNDNHINVQNLEASKCPVVKWSENNFNVNLLDRGHFMKPFNHVQDLQFTFQNKTLYTNVFEDFVQIVKQMAVRDVKMLIGKNTNSRTLTINEGEKVIAATKICFTLNTQHLLLPFWNKNTSSIPTITIINSGNSKLFKGKTEEKKLVNIQNQVNSCINRIRKLIKQ